jgi:signal transduction histidine kinase
MSLSRNSHIYLEIKDDGRGFDPATVPERSMGLQMMRYRANVIGAQLTVTSAEGGGTSVSCVIPAK